MSTGSQRWGPAHIQDRFLLGPLARKWVDLFGRTCLWLKRCKVCCLCLTMRLWLGLPECTWETVLLAFVWVVLSLGLCLYVLYVCLCVFVGLSVVWVWWVCVTVWVSVCVCVCVVEWVSRLLIGASNEWCVLLLNELVVYTANNCKKPLKARPTVRNYSLIYITKVKSIHSHTIFIVYVVSPSTVLSGRGCMYTGNFADLSSNI